MRGCHSSDVTSRVKDFSSTTAIPMQRPDPNTTRLALKNPDNIAVVSSYISGDEINDSPIFAPRRLVINFGDRPLEECANWPDLLAIVESKVRPKRLEKGGELAHWPWWQFWRTRNELAKATSGRASILAISAVSSWVSFVRVPVDVVYSHAVVLITIDKFSGFSVLQSRAHELWARFFGSSLEDRLRYTPSDCFETFPFPLAYESNAALEEAGQCYDNFRADLMVRNKEGLTKTYNRFHDPNEDSPDIVRLRELHASMDRAVLDAYGWQDIQPVCEFFPEFDEEADEDENGRPKKKNYRYKWPEAIHDELLARMLELNRQRAEEERHEAESQPVSWDKRTSASAAKPKRGRGKNGAKGDTIAEKPKLFNAEEQEV